jgi:hypothetical protein
VLGNSHTHTPGQSVDRVVSCYAIRGCASFVPLANTGVLLTAPELVRFISHTLLRGNFATSYPTATRVVLSKRTRQHLDQRGALVANNNSDRVWTGVEGRYS